jgi:hypothetical protein
MQRNKNSEEAEKEKENHEEIFLLFRKEESSDNVH